MRNKTQIWIADSLLLFVLLNGFLASAQNNGRQSVIPDSPSATSRPAATHPGTSQQPPATFSLQAQAQTQRPTPVGTAAAERPATTGVAASNPAGVAIAPPKQRRVRTLLIKVGAIVGAGVAIGAVAALASGSPSTPPGSR